MHGKIINSYILLCYPYKYFNYCAGKFAILTGRLKQKIRPGGLVGRIKTQFKYKELVSY